VALRSRGLPTSLRGFQNRSFIGRFSCGNRLSPISETLVRRHHGRMLAVKGLRPAPKCWTLDRSIAYYQKLGFTVGEPWDGFYAIGDLDGLELHLKEAPKNQADRRWRRHNEHLDASAGVDGIEAFYEQCVANGATVIKPLAATAWGTKDFYIEDPNGYIICFGGRPAAG
jgi:catechol 2,3-dioxygenase-like lactoylglutathione lyase family enzyme